MQDGKVQSAYPTESSNFEPPSIKRAEKMGLYRSKSQYEAQYNTDSKAANARDQRPEGHTFEAIRRYF